MKKLLRLGVVFCAFYCLYLSPVLLASAQEKFTLEQVMSAPFPSDLVASPAGNKLAWVLKSRGARNIWIAEAPGYKGRQLTSYSEDDGTEIGELSWTHDGGAIVYTRGGDLDGFGENPNPHSNPEEPKQLIWVISLNGTQPQQLAEGHSAVITPKDDRIIYINKRDLWQTRIDRSEKPALLVQTKGRSNSLHLSPDGSMLAFVNARGDHSFVGVLDLSSGGSGKQVR